MHVPIRSWSVLVSAVAVFLIASTAAAQIEDQVGDYTETNGEGYLQPLADAIGADLNGGIWHTAYVPAEGFYIAFETRLLATFFSDDQRTFDYNADDDDLIPVSGVNPVPTVVGDPSSGVIPTTTPPGIVYAPGFDINSFALAVPQLRIGAYKGTEAVLRYIALDVGDTELGSVSLIGFGGRHSISQYMDPDFPVDIAAGFFWQQFKLGDDLIDATATTFGVQVGKRFPSGFAVLEPYFGLSYNMFKMDVSYEYDDGEEARETTMINLEMESEAGVRATLGLHAQVGFMDLNGEYTFGESSQFALGLGFAFRQLPN